MLYKINLRLILYDFEVLSGLYPGWRLIWGGWKYQASWRWFLSSYFSCCPLFWIWINLGLYWGFQNACVYYSPFLSTLSLSNFPNSFSGIRKSCLVFLSFWIFGNSLLAQLISSLILDDNLVPCLERTLKHISFWNRSFITWYCLWNQWWIGIYWFYVTVFLYSIDWKCIFIYHRQFPSKAWEEYFPSHFFLKELNVHLK